MEPWSGSRGESPSTRWRSAGLRASPSANPVGGLRPRESSDVSQAQPVLLLPRVRRAAAVGLTVAALLAPGATAFAADDTSTGGTTAAATQLKAKKVTTKQLQKALGIKADGVMGPKTRKAIK